MFEKPEIGDEVVHIRPFGSSEPGEVAPTDSWAHPNEVTPDSVVVEFETRRSRFTVGDFTERDGTLFVDKHGFLSDSTGESSGSQ